MLFQMTQADIYHAVCRSPWSCAVARCIRRELNITIGPDGENFDRVAVRPDFIFIDGKHHWTPGSVAAFIDAFDDGLTPTPISFELPVEVSK